MRQRIGALKYVECSAKYNHGVSRVFEVATRAALLGAGRRRGSFCKFL
jgi:Ras homolog gene family, member A